MTLELWLEAHSYLRPLADLSAQVERALAGIDVPDARIPDWEDYRADFLAGVPLLPSTAAAVDLEPGGRMAGALLERLASGTSPERFAAETRALDTELRREPQVSRRSSVSRVRVSSASLPDHVPEASLSRIASAIRPPGSRSTSATALGSSGTPARKSAR